MEIHRWSKVKSIIWFIKLFNHDLFRDKKQEKRTLKVWDLQRTQKKNIDLLFDVVDKRHSSMANSKIAAEIFVECLAAHWLMVHSNGLHWKCFSHWSSWRFTCRYVCWLPVHCKRISFLCGRWVNWTFVDEIFVLFFSFFFIIYNHFEWHVVRHEQTCYSSTMSIKSSIFEKSFIVSLYWC